MDVRGATCLCYANSLASSFKSLGKCRCSVCLLPFVTGMLGFMQEMTVSIFERLRSNLR